MRADAAECVPMLPNACRVTGAGRFPLGLVTDLQAGFTNQSPYRQFCAGHRIASVNPVRATELRYSGIYRGTCTRQPLCTRSGPRLFSPTSLGFRQNVDTFRLAILLVQTMGF